MLLVRLVDCTREHAEVLSFTLSDTGEILAASGDRSLVEFDRAVPAADGRPVTRSEPVRWAQALTRAYQRGPLEMLISDVPGQSGASPTPDVARDRARRGPVRLAGAVMALLVLICVGVGIGAWQAGAIKTAAGAAGGDLANPHAALAAAAPAPHSPPPPAPNRKGTRLERTLARAADNAARELAGSGDGSVVGWLPVTGLWSRPYHPKGMPINWQAPQWWQSALSFGAVVRYLNQTHDSQPEYQQLIDHTYALNISRPGTNMPSNFANKFMDDTAWWGLGWADAVRYELHVRHDTATASRYLTLSETDAHYIYAKPRPCHAQGIAWQVGYPPDTIANEEFVAFAAELAQIRLAPGRLHDAAAAQSWLGKATHILAWLRASGLVNMSAGVVADRLNGRCQVTGGPVTYTEGEMIQALTQMGLATGARRYFDQAQPFINRVLSPALGMLGGGVLQQPCEAMSGMCVTEGHAYDSSAYKGLFIAAVSDWTRASGQRIYAGWLIAQGRAVLSDAASDGRRATACETPNACQLDFYWSRRVAPVRLPIELTPGSQESGLQALSAALAARSANRRGWRVQRSGFRPSG